MIQEVQKQKQEEDYLFFFLKARPINTPAIAPIPTNHANIKGYAKNAKPEESGISKNKRFDLANISPITEIRLNRNNTIPTIAPTHNPRNQCLAIPILKKRLFKYFSFLNKYSNRENLNFASQLFSDEKSDIISVKRKTLRSFPKSPTATSHHANIMFNKLKMLQSDSKWKSI